MFFTLFLRTLIFLINTSWFFLTIINYIKKEGLNITLFGLIILSPIALILLIITWVMSSLLKKKQDTNYCYIFFYDNFLLSLLILILGGAMLCMGAIISVFN